MKKIIKIDGMGCEHCINSVEKALENIEGIEILEVKIGEATINVKTENNVEEKLKKIDQELDDVGYEVVK